ncbi:hypothetical protein SAMN05421788_107310 [Filimonas lacunae]|uniref:DUF6965 domain-containing protein n=1 Tax=Filimonas lacunae TaxID=477680 RepID=A0A1N7QY32_9BACT|nr:hypothetical protein [Filimonas lacunae]SIT27756.1 hypothetical protein SAMN05421788_107310 [Filimonas lacunae]
MATNPISDTEITELHDFFHAHTDRLPETLLISPAETVNNVRNLVNDTFAILNLEGIPDRIRNMRINMLRKIRVALQKEGIGI